mgnify:CR=1 FL=1
MWIAIIVFVLIFIILYNQLIREKHQVDNAFSTVDVTLKKRYDLIPNLVESVRAYSKHEQAVYSEITSLRIQAMQSQDKDEVVKLDKEISDGINDIMLLAENYPELKASQNYLELQKALEKLENELSAARRTYNAAVTEYNISLEAFPTNIVANIFRFEKRELFVVENNTRNNTKINM